MALLLPDWATSWLTNWSSDKAPLPDASGRLAFLPGRYGSAPKRGTAELLRTYSESPWMRAIAGRVGDATAGLEWRLYRETKRSRLPQGAAARRLARIGDRTKRAQLRQQLVKQNALEPVEVHPFLEFLDKGVGRITGLEVRSLTQVMLDLVGDAFGIIETNGTGEPVEWYPVPPHWVKQTPRPGAEDQYELEIPGGRVRTIVPGENIVWFCNRDPLDPYARGTGVGRSLADEVAADEFVARYVKNLFYNDATPSLLIYGEGLEEKSTKRMEERWLEKLQGYINARRPLFLNKKVEVHQLQRSFEEMKLIDLRRFQRDLIMEVWGVPPEVFGVLESSNRATIESADYLFQKGVIAPRGEKQRAVLQTQLLPKYNDPLLVCDFESPVGEDKDHKRQVYSQAPWAFRVDEHRALAGEDALEKAEGQVFPSPLALLPSERPLEASESVPEEEPEPEPEPDEEPDEDEEEPDEEEEEEPKAAGPRARKEELQTLTQAEIATILRSIEGQDLAAEMAAPMQDAVASFGQSSLSDIGITIEFNSASPRVVEFLRTQSSSRISRINTTTRRQVRDTLMRGTLAGDSFDDLAKRIDHVFDVAASARSRTIARTESVRASNFGALEGMRQGGIEKKQWLSTRGDDRVRDAHQPGIGLDGVTLALEDEFVSPTTGSRGLYPGDFPEPSDSINCRCLTVAVVDEQAAATTPQQKTAYWKRNEARRAPFEGQIVRGARRGFERQRRKALRALEAAR